MVRLSSRSFLHLTPELAGEEFDEPFYARVLRVDGEVVAFRSLEGGEGTVSREVAAQHTVLAGDVNKAGRSSLLRRPVAVKLMHQVQYGQVVAVNGGRLTVRSEEEEIEAAVEDATKVAPVVALLLEHVQFNRDEWSADEVEAVECSILDRVLGQSGCVRAKDISIVLAGLIAVENHPIPTKICSWVDPKTGQLAEFPLQHAVDFAYYVDGGMRPVPDTVGNSFCSPSPPSRAVQQLQPPQGSVGDAQELFDPFADDDDSPQDQSELEHLSTDQAVLAQVGGKRAVEGLSDAAPERKRHRPALDQDALIVEKLRGHPELLERFLSIRHVSESCGDVSAAMDRPSVTSNAVVEAPLCTTTTPPGLAAAPLSVVAAPPSKKTSGTSKYAFIPREDQQVVHERITSAKHKGKPAAVLIKGMVRSEHVKFKALPGICTRAYDIQFGSSGLSIRHFARLSQADRISWLESGGSNFDNLSATAEFAPATPASCIEDVVDAVRGFLTYSREYCCVELVALVERILEFVEETLMQVPWSTKDLSVLVYWINDLLEDFRGAAETGEDLTRIIRRCSTDDHLLRDLMFVKMHRQAEAMSAGPTGGRPMEHKHGGGHQRNANNGESKKRLGRIPRDVLRQLPVQVDPSSGKSRSLCMRYLSRSGCDTASDGSCPSKRGHFVPQSLSADVKATIIQRFGGLKDEHKDL